MFSEYRFLTRWRVEGTCEGVSTVLAQPLEFPRWWSSVYLKVDEIETGDSRGVGRRIRLVTKGKLPYTLRWEYVISESRYPLGFTIRATGDFDGIGIWTLEQDGRFVNIAFDWQLRVEKPMVKRLSFLLKPLFEANHRWAMARGEEGLRRELARQRAEPRL